MIIFRITEELLRDANQDLSRPHTFSAERIGFLAARQALAGSDTLVLATAYYPIPDDHYVEDGYSGARINSQAIRNAMQKALDTGDGMFHIHPHYFGDGIPSFGRMDMREIPRIVSSMQAVRPDAAHGMLVLNNDKLFGLAKIPGSEDLSVIDKIVVVGYPTIFSIQP